MITITEQQLTDIRKLLVRQQDEIRSRLERGDHLGLNSSMSDSTGELSAYDNHPGDIATELYERGKDIALLEQEDLHLSRIREALKAIDNGTYGQCLTCKEPIPADRLVALPDTLYCIKHSPRQIVSDRRPAEEDYLKPPFGGSSKDEQDYNGFDGEDAWQIVEQWGNSDSPAMMEDTDADYDRMMIEADENDGYVESMESFLATDITGKHVTVVRNRAYKKYMADKEGDPFLEWEETGAEDEQRGGQTRF